MSQLQPYRLRSEREVGLKRAQGRPGLVSFQARDIPYPFSAGLRFNNMTDPIYLDV